MTVKPKNVRPRRAVGLVAAVGVLVTLVGTGVAADATRAVRGAVGLAEVEPVAAAEAVPLPAACNPTPNPPPTQYGFVARVKGGTLDGDRVAMTDLDLSVCGIIEVVDAQDPGCEGVQGLLKIPGEGVVVNSMKTTYTPIPDKVLEVPATVEARPVEQLLPCSDSADGITTDLSVDLLGRVGVFGIECAVPATGTLKGTITGKLLTPPFEGDAVLTGELSLEPVANNDKYCPGTLPDRVDELLDLPLEGNATRLPAKVSVYHPS